MMSTMDTFIQDAKANGSPAKWVGCPYPVMNKGDKPSAIFYEDPVVNTVAGISTNCPEEKVELALRWLDYPFSEEGFYYWNFGTEGDTYTMENGEAVFTDKITKNELDVYKRQVKVFMKQSCISVKVPAAKTEA